MASDILSVPAPPPEPADPVPGRTTPDATSDATRLLCAGAYLDREYRAAVIRVLTHPFRVVAPSYGYDAVPVLAHALAARRLHRLRLAVLGAGLAGTVVLMVTGVLSGIVALLTMLWLVWVTAFLQRVVTLQTLTNRLRAGTGAAGARDGFDGSYPDHPLLTARTVEKINHEQTADGSLIRYGGYKPFVGAGGQVRRWSTAELLIGAPANVLDQHRGGAGAPTAAGAQEPRRKEVVPFTGKEITDYVAGRMNAELRDRARRSERIGGLAVEQSAFTRAVTTIRPGGREPDRAHRGAGWAEGYDAQRVYLCVRVGSWNQELVTTAFVGFDLKGNTLHTEFYSYVLAPIRRSFHLVDRLPAALNGPLLLRVAKDTLLATPGAAVGALFSWVPAVLAFLGRGDSRVRTNDPSEFRLGRYAVPARNTGALTSVRELATSADFHVFFQETDTIKYTQIVERQLLQFVRDFLQAHNVDLAEHEARQTNILNDYRHHNNHVENNHGNVNSGTQNVHHGSGGGKGGGGLMTGNDFGLGNDFGHNNNFVNDNSGSVNSGTQNFYDGGAPAAPRPSAPRPADAGQGGSGAAAPDRGRSVFVVHGRDEEARLKIFDLLRLLDLRPLEWEDLVRATGRTAPFLGEVIAQAPAQAQAALVLLTPDDVVQLHPDLRGPNEPPYESEPTGQPRPNVLIELGMVLMAYPERTLMVEIGALRAISDIGGMNVIRFDGSATALGKIVERLKLAGCKVNDTGSDWRQTWPYRHLSAYHRTGREVPPAR